MENSKRNYGLFDGYFWVGELETSEEVMINSYSFNLNYMTNIVCFGLLRILYDGCGILK